MSPAEMRRFVWRAEANNKATANNARGQGASSRIFRLSSGLLRKAFFGMLASILLRGRSNEKESKPPASDNKGGNFFVLRQSDITSPTEASLRSINVSVRALSISSNAKCTRRRSSYSVQASCTFDMVLVLEVAARV